MYKIIKCVDMVKDFIEYTYGLLYFLLDAFGGGGVRDRLRLWPRDMTAGFGAGSLDPLRVLERLLCNHREEFKVNKASPAKYDYSARGAKSNSLIIVPLCLTC